MWTVQKQADAKVALCSLLSPESASYQILSPVATNCHSYQFFADTNLPLLPESLSAATKTVQDTSFSLLLVFPCYQTFAAVLDSPGSAPVTRSSLSLLLNCPHTSFSLLLVCPCYQIFAAVLDSGESAHVNRFSLQLLRSLRPRPSPFRLGLCRPRKKNFVSPSTFLRVAMCHQDSVICDMKLDQKRA